MSTGKIGREVSLALVIFVATAAILLIPYHLLKEPEFKETASWQFPGPQCEYYREHFPQKWQDMLRVYEIDRWNIERLSWEQHQCLDGTSVVRVFNIQLKTPLDLTVAKDMWIVVGDWHEPDTLVYIPEETVTVQNFQLRFQENTNTGGDVQVNTGNATLPTATP